MKPSEYATHVLAIGWILVGTSLILVVVGFFGLLLFGGLGLVALVAEGDGEPFGILGCFGLTGLLFFSCLALPGLLAGYGLLSKKSWGRVAAIIVAAIHLFNIPIGTLIGIYALWILTHEQSAAYFGEGSNAGVPQQTS